MAREVEAKHIIYDSFDDSDDCGWKTSEGLPRYRIGAEIIDRLTGRDEDAEYALLRRHVRFKDVPGELYGDDKKDERVEWMINQIPEAERAVREADRAELAKRHDGIELDLPLPDKDAAREIERRKHEIQQLERLRGSKIIVKGDTLVTLYHAQTPSRRFRGMKNRREQ